MTRPGVYSLITGSVLLVLMAATLVIAVRLAYKHIREGQTRWAVLLFSVLGTVTLLLATGWVGDRLKLGVISGWGLMHGSFLIFAPVYFVILYWIASSPLISRGDRRS